MKSFVSIFAVLPLVVPAFAGNNVFVMSSHQTSVTDYYGATAFVEYSESTKGYSDDGSIGYSLLSCEFESSLIAEGTSEDKKFDGWYSKKGGWAYNLEDVTVDSADKKISDSPTLDWDTIQSEAGTDGHPTSPTFIVVAKYISLYKIEGEVLPESAGTISGTNTYEEGKSVSLEAKAEPGYSFEKWMKDGAVLSTEKKLSFTATNGCAGTYVANLPGNVYMVSFDANGGDGGAPSPKAVTYGAKYGNLGTCTWASHSFAGWFTEKEGGEQITADSDVLILADQTLFAHWTAESYTITYKDATEFGGELLKTESVSWGGTATPPDNPTHPGWTFDEWTGWNGFSDVKQNRDYTAIGHNNNYFVRYHANNGTGQSEQETFTCYESKPLSENGFSKRGYVFVGWDTNDVGTTVVYANQQEVINLTYQDSFDLYAVWAPISYTVRFDKNGGAGEMADSAIKYDQAYVVPPCGFDKSGCEFRDWGVIDSTFGPASCRPGDVVSNLTDVAGGVVTLKARWQEFYVVSFDANGGEGSMTNVLFERDVEYPLPSNRFVRIGYGFDCWSTNGVKAFADGAHVKNLAEAGATNVLFAAWIANSYSVRFNANPPPGMQATGTMADQVFVYDEPQALLSNRFDCTELWIFAGWSNTVSGATYSDGEAVSNLCATADDVLVLNALWRSNIGELSEAMGCNNLRWIDGTYKGEKPGWTVCSDTGYESGSSALHESSDFLDATMHARIFSPGKLRFRWRPTFGEVLTVSVKFYEGDEVHVVSRQDVFGDNESWENPVELDVLQNPEVDFNKIVTVEIMNYNSLDDRCKTYIDQMIWTPEGGGTGPKQGDSVEAMAAGVNGNVFSLTIPTTGGTEYGVWTNADVTVPAADWGLMETKRAEGTTLDFSLEVLSGVPQLFFRAYKVDYK